MTIGRSILGYSNYRRGPDKLVHIASRMTFESPYAGWWQSRCEQSFIKGVSRGRGRSKPVEGPPTCLQCIGAEIPMYLMNTGDTWRSL